VHRSDIATHSLLGGQHGEESQESEEGQEGEEEEGEEVTFLSERRIRQRLSKAASQRPARPKAISIMLLRVATPVLVDDGGRRQNQDHPSRDWLSGSAARPDNGPD
jgi:hypothetical protein